MVLIALVALVVLIALVVLVALVVAMVLVKTTMARTGVWRHQEQKPFAELLAVVDSVFTPDLLSNLFDLQPGRVSTVSSFRGKRQWQYAFCLASMQKL